MAILVCCLLGCATIFADTLPIISAHPQSLTVSPGSNAVLSVTASSATSYQWRFNGSDIVGGTNASLTVTNAQLTNSGYYVVITKNALGWVPSLPAYLSVVDTAGLVPFSNKFLTNEMASYQETAYYGAGGYGPISNGTARVIAGPALDQMQPLANTLIVRGGFFGLMSTAVPTVAGGQTVYYRIGISYPLSGAPSGVWTQLSTVLPLTAGGGAFSIPSYTNLYFPGWLEWPDDDPGFRNFPPPYSTPTNQLRIVGETFSLTNVFFGYLGDLGPRTIQWRRDGQRIGSPVTLSGYTGLTNGTLSFTNVQPADAGIYDIEYLGNNWVIGPKTFLSVQITNGQGVLQAPRLAGTNFSFDLLCAPRRRYLIQRSTDLTVWSDLQTVTNSSDNSTYTATITNNSAGAGAAFYRGKLLP